MHNFLVIIQDVYFILNTRKITCFNIPSTNIETDVNRSNPRDIFTPTSRENHNFLVFASQWACPSLVRASMTCQVTCQASKTLESWQAAWRHANQVQCLRACVRNETSSLRKILVPPTSLQIEANNSTSLFVSIILVTKWEPVLTRINNSYYKHVELQLL